MRGEAHKHVCLCGITDAIVKFRHVARAARKVSNEFAETLETATLFRQGDCKKGFSLFAHLRPFGHKSKAVKIDVGAAQNGSVGLTFGFVLGHILFDGGYSQSTRGLHDRAGVYKHILDGGANRIGVDGDVFVDQAARNSERFFAHQLHGGAIRKQTHVVQGDAFLGIHRLNHGVGIVHLHANDFNFGPDGLDVIGHARNEATATNGHKHSVQRALMLAQDFHGNGALAGNDIGIVKGMDKGHAHFFLKQASVLVRVRIALAHQHHFASQSFHRIHFHLRCGGGHDNDGTATQLSGPQRHTLCMIARRSANHAFFQLCGRQMRHLVVGAAQFKTVHGLLVFALEQHRVVQALA